MTVSNLCRPTHWPRQWYKALRTRSSSCTICSPQILPHAVCIWITLTRKPSSYVPTGLCVLGPASKNILSPECIQPQNLNSNIVLSDRFSAKIPMPYDKGRTGVKARATRRRSGWIPLSKSCPHPRFHPPASESEAGFHHAH